MEKHNNSTIKLKKKHYKCRECTAMGAASVAFENRINNLSDCLTIFLPELVFKKIVQCTLFQWNGKMQVITIVALLYSGLLYLEVNSLAITCIVTNIYLLTILQCRFKLVSTNSKV